jgi:hypothetical protein
MNWLRNLFGKGPARREAQRPTFRPRLEELEDRRLLNVSPVFDSMGNRTTFAVYDNGALYQYTSTSVTVLATSGVRVAHGFRDRSGNVGLDVVYDTGAAFEYDSTGGRMIASSGILDLSRAYDAAGNFRLEVLYNDGSGFTGNLYQYTNTSVTFLGSGVRFATAYVDAAGKLGLAYGIVDSSTNQFVYTVDSFGIQTLYQGSFVITQSIGDFDEATDSFGRTFFNVVFNPANGGPGSLGSPHTGVEYGPGGPTGWGFNIRPN